MNRKKMAKNSIQLIPANRVIPVSAPNALARYSRVIISTFKAECTEIPANAA
jgi:hypothetical protein